MSWISTLKKASKETDPVKRMKLAVTQYIQTHFINPTIIQCRVPINPIIGETYQREMPSGEKIYCEQIAHRPSITAYLIEDPDGDYKWHGHFHL